MVPGPAIGVREGKPPRRMDPLADPAGRRRVPHLVCPHRFAVGPGPTTVTDPGDSGGYHTKGS